VALLLVGALPLSCKSETGGGDSNGGDAGGSAGASASTGGSLGDGGDGASGGSGGGGSSGGTTGGNSTAGTNTNSGNGGSSTGGDSSTGTDAGGAGGNAAAAGAGGACDGCDSSWGNPVLLDIGHPGAGRVAMNQDGAAVVVWTRFEDDYEDYDIAASLYTPGEGWGATELVAPDREEAEYAGIDDEGNALVTWDHSGQISARRYAVGVGWEATEVVNADRAEDASRCSVAMAANGSALAVWAEHVTDAEWPLLSSQYQPGEGWASAVPIAVGTETDELLLAVNPSGNALALWTQYTGDVLLGTLGETLWSSHWEAGSEWTAPESIQSDDAISYPDVAIDPQGNGIAVWRGSNDEGSKLWTNRFDASSGWEGAEPLSTTPLDASQTSLDMDADGNAVAVWVQSASGDDCSVWSRPYTLESGWGDPEMIGAARKGTCFGVKVAVGAAGDAVAMWGNQFEVYDGENRYLSRRYWSTRYTPGLGWSEAEAFDVDIELEDFDVDGDGNAMALLNRSYRDLFVSISTRPQ